MADRAAGEAHTEQVGYVLDLIEGARVQAALLREAVEALRGSAAQLAVSEKAQLPQLTTDFPFAGSHRWLIPRIASGGKLATFEEKAVDLLPANPNRLGGWVSVEQAHLICLADADTVNGRGVGSGIGLIFVDRETPWDLRLGNLLWSGSVSAVAHTELESHAWVTEV